MCKASWVIDGSGIRSPFLLSPLAHAREICSKLSITLKRFLSSAESGALPGLSTTTDFMPAEMAASTSLTLSLKNRIDSGAS